MSKNSNPNDCDESRRSTEVTEIVVDENSSNDSILPPDNTQSALDVVITKIGMGKFQKQLLVLCGLGWLSDNMWIQCTAVILPRVQRHFDLPNSLIGVLSSSLFTGMMFGALFWGVLSDFRGRKQAFKWTLAITAVFGIFSSFAQSFFQLCFMFFLLGFGVGGNIPTDGALFLEFIPKEYQYLLTFMSVFFSFGAVLTSTLAYFILPPHSCSEVPCDVSKENNGWRYLLALLGSLTFLMFLCRILFFRQESPKYLISRNRKDDAVFVLREIAKINDNNMKIQVNDISTPANTTNSHSITTSKETQYPKIEFISNPISYIKSKISSSFDAVMPLFTRKLFATTILVWCIWIFVSFAYTTFNVFLPKYLESGRRKDTNDSLIQNVLKDYIIYSLCGVPGSLVGAWLIETFLGRIGTMSIAAFGTALAVFLFSMVKSHYSEVIFSAMTNFLATLNYAAIYGYTPEVFESKIRGTAYGIASALGRVASIIAPAVTGTLFSINAFVPLHVSVSLFTISGICMVLLPIETRGRQA